MFKVLIFGNSGSGKSTLARKLSLDSGLAHLDLDLIAWKPSSPPERAPFADSRKNILEFIESNAGWVIEGCYTDLLEVAAPHSNDLIFMNLSVEKCIENAKRRPWEPHKYESREAQDANLQMLIDWIGEYPNRTDTFSHASHLDLFEKHASKKRMVIANE